MDGDPNSASYHLYFINVVTVMCCNCEKKVNGALLPMYDSRICRTRKHMSPVARWESCFVYLDHIMFSMIAWALLAARKYCVSVLVFAMTHCCNH